jgi:hypothetical protein
MGTGGQFLDLGNVTRNENAIEFEGNGWQYGEWTNPMKIVLNRRGYQVGNQEQGKYFPNK